MGRVLNEIPYVSQRGDGAPLANDCGQACVVSLIHAYSDARPTVIEASRRAGLATGKTTGNLDLIRLAQMYGVRLETEGGADYAFYVNELYEGRPAIALVNYWPIGAERFPHWVLVVGYDDTGAVYIHDPYRRDLTGFTRLTRDAFTSAIEDVVPAFNYRRVGLRYVPPATPAEARQRMRDAVAAIRAAVGRVGDVTAKPDYRKAHGVLADSADEPAEESTRRLRGDI